MAQNLANLRNVSGNMVSHIIPTSNESYDIESAEYKIRHNFISDNTLYLGDFNKLHVDRVGFKVSTLDDNGDWKTRRLATEAV